MTSFSLSAIQKKTQSADYAGEITEEKLSAVMMIPAAGEYVYDTESQYKVPGYDGGSGFIQQGAQIAINQHTPFGKANSLVAMDQLEAACPNVDWVGVVVAWFGDSLDAATCEITPGVEYQVGGITNSNTWGVGGYVGARKCWAFSWQYVFTPDCPIIAIGLQLRLRSLES